MKVPDSTSKKSQTAQAMIEFALVFPLLVFVLYGILEFGRMLFIYTSVVNASREAARYGASVGNVGAYRFLDCTGILNAARRNAILNAIDPANMTISYDRGPGTANYSTSCATLNEALVKLGDRINITVTITYSPLMPVNFATFPISSTASRTIIRGVEVSGAVIANITPTATFSSSGPTDPVDESVGSISFNIQLDVASSLNIVVPISVSGTASNGADYTINALTFTFLPGETSKQVTLTINDDALDEYDETVVVTMGVPVNANRGNPSVFNLVIRDNDNPPNLYFQSATSSFNEEAGTVSIPVSLSAISGKDITFTFGLGAGSTATLNVDFELGPTSVLIPAGTSGGVVVVVLRDDRLYERDETVVLSLNTVNPGTDGLPTAVITTPNPHTLTILNTDPPPVIRFELATSITGENVGLAILKVRLNRISGLDATVAISRGAASTALPTSDYTLPSGPPFSVTVPAGQIEKEFTILITKDTETPPELDETLVLVMGAVTDCTLGSPSTHTLTIMETTIQPNISFISVGQSINENAADPATVQVILSNAWGAPVTVNLAEAGTATPGVDYTSPGITSITIPAGALAYTISVPIIDDTLDEDNETVIFTLSGPTNAVLIAPSQHVVTIVDDDLPPTVSFTTASSGFEEGSGAVAVQVVLSTASGRNIQVSFTRTGTAVSGTDFTLTTTSPITFAPGVTSQTINLTIPDDAIYTGLRTVVFSLTAPVNVTLGAIPVHTLTIIENEICPTVSSLNFNSDQITTILSLPTGATTVTLRDLTVNMEPGQQRLNLVFLGTGGSSQIFNGSVASTTIFETGTPTWTGGVRTLNGGEGKVLLLDFKDDIPANKRNRYPITVYWSNGCSATVSP